MKKILLTTDFSKASQNAAIYLAKLMKPFNDVTIYVVHCFPETKKSFLGIENVTLNKQIENDFKYLNAKLDDVRNMMLLLNPDLAIETKIYNTKPDLFLADYAEQESFQLVVAGSNGMTALKDITLGSISEYLIKNIDAPVLVVPGGYDFSDVNHIMLTIGNRKIESLDCLSDLLEILNRTNAKMTVLHLKKSSDENFEFDPGLQYYFENHQVAFDQKVTKDSIALTISNLAKSNEVDLLCMIQSEKSWFAKLLDKGSIKSELFYLTTPLLIVKDKSIA